MSAVSGSSARTDRRTLFLAAAFAAAALILAFWTGGMAVLSPAQHRVWNRATLVWTGYDTGMVAALGAAALLAWRRDARLPLVATALAVMLAVDAWFDVSTSSGPGFRDATTLAGFIEIPLAIGCAVLALRGQQALTAVARR